MRYGVAIALFPFIAAFAGCAAKPMSNDAFDNPTLAPLAVAVARGDAAEIKRLTANVHPDTPGANGATLLVEAIGKGRMVGIEKEILR